MSNPEFKDAGVIATDGGGQAPKKEAQPPLEVKGVKHIVAVASGKGGVGKS
ncbi:MAG TPA: ATP-binding protein, partial [Gammaproteobacteria bacterium]|nr:ATP-binding protein [Gammaproteobacteria bacterium]